MILFAILLSSAHGVPEEMEILFVGDSDIELWEKTNDLYPDSLNRGIGGSTCSRWKNDRLITKKVDKHMPSIVVLVCGENDLPGRNVNRIFKDFSKVVEKTFALGVGRILYFGTKPEPDTKKLHKRYQKYDQLIRENLVNNQENKDGSFVMIDVYPAFVELGNKRNLYDKDGLHLSNNKGYKLWNAWLTLALITPDCVLWKLGECMLRTNEIGDTNSPTGFPTGFPSS